MEKLTYNPDELAKVLGISRPKAYELTKTDGFPVVKLGKRLLIPIASLEAWLYQQAESAGR